MSEMFAETSQLALGLFSGILFGFLLQKGQVTKQKYVLGTFLLKNFVAVKIIFTAVLVGAIGVYAMNEFALASLHIKPLTVGGLVAGGILFAFGLSLFGYCPGTSIGASAEGHRDAMVGVAGMVAGAFAFVWLHTSISPIIQMAGDYGKVTLPDITGTSPWFWILGLSVVALTVFVQFDYRRRKTSRTILNYRLRHSESSFS